jgi:hypothetical protein
MPSRKANRTNKSMMIVLLSDGLYLRFMVERTKRFPLLKRTNTAVNNIPAPNKTTEKNIEYLLSLPKMERIYNGDVNANIDGTD